MQYRKLGWLLALLAPGLMSAVVARAAWEQDWSDAGPAFDLDRNYDLKTAGAADGAALIGFSTGAEYRLSRFRADGSLAWHTAMPLGEWRPYSLSHEPDGSALVLLTGISYASVVRFDAAGTLQWSTALQGTHFAVGGDTVAGLQVLSNRDTVVTAIDRYSGQWRWQRRIGGVAGDSLFPSRLAVDDAGNFYFGGSDANASRLIKLDPQGDLLWSRGLEAGGFSAIAVRNGQVFLATRNGLQVVRAADGQLQWHTDLCGVGDEPQVLSTDDPVRFVGDDPLCTSYGEMRRLDRGSGAEVWRRTFDRTLVGVFGDDVLLAAEPELYPVADGVLQCLDGSTGASRWQVSVPFALRGMIWPLSDGLIGVAGPGIVPETRALHRFRRGDGSVFDVRSLPNVPRGVRDTGTIRDGADLFVLGQAPWKEQPTRARRLVADSGALIWENANAERRIDPGVALSPRRLFLADRTEFGEARVRSIDRASGQQRWEKVIAPAGHLTPMNKPPRVLGLGDDDVLLSYGYGPYDSTSISRRVQELQRIDDAAGGVVWNKTIAEWSDSSTSTYWTEPALLAVGEDALLWPGFGIVGPFFDVQRRAAGDGAIQFATSAGMLAEIVRLSVAGDAVFAVSQVDQTTLRLVKHSASTGQRQWQFDYPMQPWRSMQILDAVPLADGDVLLLFLLYDPASAGPQSTRLLRVKGDGSGLRYAYRTTGPSALRDSIDSIVLAPAGEALLRRRLFDGRRGLDFLQRFDLAQGRVIGSQALAPRGVDPFLQYTAWGPRLERYGEGLLASGIAVQAPLPLARRDALLDIGVVRRGDLALELSPVPAGLAADDAMPFSAVVSYTGDAAVTDATLILELPWQGSESGLQCGGPGVTRCEFARRHGQIIARFDAVPGARLSLSGQVLVLHAPMLDAAVLRGMVFAPMDLLESDFVNNFQRIAKTGLIFADGFD